METKQLIEIGTRVIVTYNLSDHFFNKGDECICVQKDSNSYGFTNQKGIFSWMESSEFEIIVPESANHQQTIQKNQIKQNEKRKIKSWKHSKDYFK